MQTQSVGLGELLKRHRARLGLTQEELAERAGISARTISDVERGLRSAVYRDTADRLADALELADDQRIELQRAGRARRAPRVHPIGSTSTVPLPPSPIVGRESEIAAISAELRSGDARIVVITGPGGIGKTRLATEIALLLEHGLRDGAAFLDLSGTFDPELLPVVLASGLAVAQFREPLRNRIVERLQERELLVVLDTFEHLIDGAPLIAEISAACPSVRFLVTSRMPLRLRGERNVPLAPLAVDGQGEPDPPAVALFLDRARSVRPDVRVDSIETGRQIAAICRRLDGIPLAIELAAARVRHLPVAGLREALDAPLDVLKEGPRDAPERQRSMREAVGWSYDLLARDDQTLLRKLSIFSGGWTRDAAASVAAPETLPGVDRLIDHSLVFLSEAPDAAARFRMFDVIREFAAEKRDALDETEDLSRAHAGYCVLLAETEEPLLRGTDQAAAMQRVAAESDNVRQALRWSVSTRASDLALRISGALWQFWRLRGELVEGRAWLEEALALPDGSPHERAKALWGAGWLALHQGDVDRAEALGVELRDASDEAGDALGKRNGLTVLAKVATARGTSADAVAFCEAALEICREVDRGWHLATSVFNLGTAVLLAGDVARAESLFAEALDRYRSLGDEIFAARTVGYLGYPALLRGDTASARRYMLESLTRVIEIDDTWGIAEALERLAGLEAAAGDAPRAAEIAGAAGVVRDTVFIEPMREESAIIAPAMRNARERIGEDEWQRALDRGKELAPESVRDALRPEAASGHDG